MDLAVEIVKFATAVVGLAGAVVTVFSKTRSTPKRSKKKGRRK